MVEQSPVPSFPRTRYLLNYQYSSQSPRQLPLLSPVTAETMEACYLAHEGWDHPVEGGAFVAETLLTSA
jgi:hypothetical protein